MCCIYQSQFCGVICLSLVSDAFDFSYLTGSQAVASAGCCSLENGEQSEGIEGIVK